MTKETTKSAKQQLAEGAAKLQKLRSQGKKKPEKPADVSLTIQVDENPEVFVPIEECKDPLIDILKRCVKENPAHTAIEITEGTTTGEYLRVFDYFVHEGEFSPLRMGDVVNAAPRIFGEKYAAILASTGRSLSTVKTWASVARNIPSELRNLHKSIGLTHLREIVKAPKLEDKKEIVEKMVKAAEAGKPMTTKEVRAEADKFAPRKPKPKKPKAEVDYVASDDENMRLNRIIADAEDLAAALKDKDNAFLKLLSQEDTKELRKHLAGIGAIYQLLLP